MASGDGSDDTRHAAGTVLRPATREVARQRSCRLLAPHEVTRTGRQYFPLIRTVHSALAGRPLPFSPAHSCREGWNTNCSAPSGSLKRDAVSSE